MERVVQSLTRRAMDTRGRSKGGDPGWPRARLKMQMGMATPPGRIAMTPTRQSGATQAVLPAIYVLWET